MHICLSNFKAFRDYSDIFYIFRDQNNDLFNLCLNFIHLDIKIMIYSICV